MQLETLACFAFRLSLFLFSFLAQRAFKDRFDPEKYIQHGHGTISAQTFFFFVEHGLDRRDGIEMSK
jgi:hypothetical protein